MRWLNRKDAVSNIGTASIIGVILGLVHGGFFVHHLSPMELPFGSFLYLLYLIGIYVLICSGLGFLIGLISKKLLRKLVLIQIIVGIPAIIFVTLFLLSKWESTLSYYPVSLQNILYAYSQFITNFFIVAFYFIIFSILVISIHFTNKKEIAIFNRNISLFLPIACLLFCLTFYWFYTQKYMVIGNSSFALGLNRSPDKSHKKIFEKADLVNNRNIIFIVIDALRADHLSCYGYERLTSPNIDEFAKQSVLFSNAIAQKTKTSPSMASFLTGTYPRTHGIISIRTPLYEDAITIGEVLKKHNYRTASVVSNGNLGYAFNFDQGFDDVFELWMKGSSNIAESVNKHAFQWLEKNYQDKFFLYLHYIDPHGKYTPPPPYNEIFVDDKFYGKLKNIKVDIKSEHWNAIHKYNVLLEGPRQTDLDYYISQYDGEIRYCDKYIGQLLRKIKELGLDKNTLIVLTADHGEDLTWHDYYFEHGTFTYESCAHIPFIVSVPMPFKPKVVENVVESVDLFPTILDFLGMPRIKGLQGESLFPILNNENTEDTDSKKIGFVEGNYARKVNIAIRTKDWKLIYNPYLLRTSGSIYQLIDALDFDSICSPTFIIFNSWSYLCNVIGLGLKNYNMMYELYNIKEDPREQNNLFAKRRDIAIPLKEKLMAWIKEHPRVSIDDLIGENKKMTLDKKTKENLKALGYIQ